MATRITTTLVDDIDPTQEASETVSFALDGTTYEIDLTEENAQSIRALIGTWAGYARVIARPRPVSSGKRRDRNADYDPVAVREWAKSQGIELSERGRISASVIAAYKAGH